MPKFAFNDDQIADIAAFLHSFTLDGYDDSARNGRRASSIGDAAGARRISPRMCVVPFAGWRPEGHRAKFTDPRALQQAWLLPGGGGAAAAARLRPAACAADDGHGDAAVG